MKGTADAGGKIHGASDLEGAAKSGIWFETIKRSSAVDRAQEMRPKENEKTVLRPHALPHWCNSMH